MPIPTGGCPCRTKSDFLSVISISTDNGAIWQWTWHIENTPKGRFDYPSIIQSRDGSIHVTYSYNTKTIKHAHFDEAWVQEGEPK